MKQHSMMVVVAPGLGMLAGLTTMMMLFRLIAFHGAQPHAHPHSPPHLLALNEHRFTLVSRIQIVPFVSFLLFHCSPSRHSFNLLFPSLSRPAQLLSLIYLSLLPSFTCSHILANHLNYLTQYNCDIVTTRDPQYHSS